MNSDRILDLADPVLVLRHLFLGDTPIPCLDAADANDDGLVDTTDAIASILHLFVTNEPLPPPFAECGRDPTDDGLTCETYAGCSAVELPCEHDLDAPALIEISADGGRIAVPVRTTRSCPWEATVDVPWVRIVRNDTGPGPKTIELEVEPHDEPGRRRGTLRVGSAVRTIEQPGCTRGCCGFRCPAETISLLPRGNEFDIPGRTLRLDIRAPDHCLWELTSSGWLRTPTRCGRGDATVWLSAGRNIWSSDLQGHVNVNGVELPYVLRAGRTSGLTLPAVFRPSEGAFYALGDAGRCGTLFPIADTGDGFSVCLVRFAEEHDTPVRADFDGDGIPDAATWRPSDGVWRVIPSVGECLPGWEAYDQTPSSPVCERQFGRTTDRPIAAADVDGDGRADPVVWRPSTGEWFALPSSGRCAAPFRNWGRTPDGDRRCTRQWGLPGDTPLVGDFDGDGHLDLVAWRPSEGNWYLLSSSGEVPPHFVPAGTTQDGRAVGVRQFGLPDDVPLAGDFDGDGMFDCVVWRPGSGNWYVLGSRLEVPVPLSRAGRTPDRIPYGTRQWGLPGDVPVAADFSGDGRCDLVVWRPADGTWYLLSQDQRCPVTFSNAWLEPDGHAACTRQFGLPGDVPAP